MQHKPVTMRHIINSHIGYNYRMSNICAGIGRGQMMVLEHHIAARRNNHLIYCELLKDLGGSPFLKTLQLILNPIIG